MALTLETFEYLELIFCSKPDEKQIQGFSVTTHLHCVPGLTWSPGSEHSSGAHCLKHFSSFTTPVYAVLLTLHTCFLFLEAHNDLILEKRLNISVTP